MSKLKQLAEKRPLLFVLLMILLLILLMGGSAIIATLLLPYTLTDVEPQTIGQVVATTGFLILLWRWNWLSPAGITQPGSRRLWLITLFILAYTGGCALLGLFGTFAVDFSVNEELIADLTHATLAGVMEEILFRGLILYVLAKAWGASRQGIVAAVMTSALLFGGLHFFNLLQGAPTATTVLQVTEALLSAILYGALVLAGGSVWPAVALHSLINLLATAVAANIPDFEVTPSAYLAFILLEIPTFVYGLYLLKRVKLVAVIPRADPTLGPAAAATP